MGGKGCERLRKWRTSLDLIRGVNGWTNAQRPRPTGRNWVGTGGKGGDRLRVGGISQVGLKLIKKVTSGLKACEISRD